jgi:hypothetical protein
LQFFATSFDDSGWPSGQGAFGTTSTICSIQGTVNTEWDPDTDMLLRSTFDADPLLPVTAYWAIDNDAMIHVNGTLVASVTHEGCAALDEFSVVIPEAILMETDNVLAVWAHDRGAVAYFDLRLEGTLPPTAVEGRSFGRVKALYR